MKHIVFILCLFLFAVAPNLAHADDLLWEFDVPVELKGIHSSADTFMVSVDVKESGGSTIASKGGVHTPLSDPGGNYSGTQTLRIYEEDLEPGKKPEDAATYTVKLWWVLNGTITDPDKPGTSNKYYNQTKSGTPRLVEYTGPMTQINLGLAQKAIKVS